MPTLATPANMRRFEEAHPRVAPNVEPLRALAYSPITGEEYSATSGDYWSRPDDEPLRDSEGEPMQLVVRGGETFHDAFPADDGAPDIRNAEAWLQMACQELTGYAHEHNDSRILDVVATLRDITERATILPRELAATLALAAADDRSEFDASGRDCDGQRDRGPDVMESSDDGFRFQLTVQTAGVRDARGVRRGVKVRYAELVTRHDAVDAIAIVAKEQGLLNEGEQIVGIERIS